MVGHLRRPATRNKQVNRLEIMPSSQLARNFKTYECPHAVTKEGERLFQIWKECLSRCPNESRKPVKRRLLHPRLPSGKLNRTDFNDARHSVHPPTKDCGSAACIRETEKPQPRLRIWLVIFDPRRGNN